MLRTDTLPDGYEPPAIRFLGTLTAVTGFDGALHFATMPLLSAPGGGGPLTPGGGGAPAPSGGLDGAGDSGAGDPGPQGSSGDHGTSDRTLSTDGDDGNDDRDGGTGPSDDDHGASPEATGPDAGDGRDGSVSLPAGSEADSLPFTGFAAGPVAAAGAALAAVGGVLRRLTHRNP